MVRFSLLEKFSEQAQVFKFTQGFSDAERLKEKTVSFRTGDSSKRLLGVTRCEYTDIQSRRQIIRLVEHGGQAVKSRESLDPKVGPSLRETGQRKVSKHSLKQVRSTFAEWKKHA